MLRAILLTCGILSSLLYVSMNVFVAMRWQADSSVSQTITELSAINIGVFLLWVVVLAVTLLRMDEPRPKGHAAWGSQEAA